MTIWILTVATVATIFVWRLILAINRHSKGSWHHPLFEIGSERAEVWIPGDRNITDNDDYDYDDFDDL